MIALDRDESLVQAAWDGDLAEMKRLITMGADVNARFDGSTPVLVAAIQSGKYEAVELLLRRGADPSVVNETDGPSLQAAFRKEPRLKSLLTNYGYRHQVQETHFSAGPTS